MTTLNTTATTVAAMVRHRDTAHATPQSWALTLAVMALLGLAVLGLLGADFGTAVQASADTDGTGFLTSLGRLDAMLAGIRWVR